VIALAATILTLLPTGTPDAEGQHLDATIWSAGLFVLLMVAALALPWDRWPAAWQAVIPFAYMVVVVLLRHAQGSGDAGYTILFILPVAWLALYGPTWQLVASLPVVAGLILLPPVLDGPLLGEQHYPATDNALTVIVLLIILFVAGALRFATDAASVDALTGLSNRRVFMARLRRKAFEASAARRPFSVAVIDLDHFKTFNDTHGHAAGDRLLEATALQWQSITRQQDVLGRIGGEEFGLIVDGGAADCMLMTERLIAAVPEQQTASAGVAEFIPGEDPASALIRADAALYAAKDAGRARVLLGSA
jgi:diguanylate cyclase (GGDEF)-like protein